MNEGDLIGAVLRETEAVIGQVPELSDFVGESLADLQYDPEEARDLPVATRISGMQGATSARTANLVRAIADAAPVLCWQQTYSEAQVGAEFLAGYGWLNLVSPEGPFISDEIRVAVGYWEKGLTYPQHAHAPEEIYIVLAGGAVFESEGREPVAATPGDVIHHAPNQMHGIAMTDTPLLAMAFWKGEGLMNKSRLERVA